ncbi:unnamed protein product [Schistosoma curassoni]|nr:unnamed protein product [Schistosoma curassoni]
MTSQISVSSAPANDSNDFSIRMRFQVGLFPQMSIPPIGTNLAVRMEALLTPKITVDIPMSVSSNCPIQYDSVNFTKCPPQVEVGGVYEYSVDYFISRPIGDYVFTFTTDEFSASIGHISLALPTTFSTYPEGYKIDTQQFVGYNFVLTTIGYVSVSNLQNSAKISPLGKNSTVNFCESQLIAFAGPNLAAKSNLTSKNTSVVNQAEKLQFFNLQLSILPSTTARYSIYITNTGKLNTEQCSVDYLLTENNSTKKSSSQVPGVDLISIDSKTVKNQVIPNYLTSLKLTLTLKPNVWQTIYFQLYVPGAYQEYILVKPIMLSQSTSLPYVSLVSNSLENMVYISIDKTYYEGIATDQTTSAVNQLTYYIPMFTANSVRPLVNFTYNLTVNSISIFGNFIFTTTTPAAFTTTLTNTWTLNYPSATDVYKQMCTGGPFEFILNMCPVERRCSFFTYWINRIVNGSAALNVTKVDVYKIFSDVRLSTSFSLNLTSERSYVRVDYGPSCLINQDFYCTQFKHTLYLMGDCNVTTTIKYTFPTFVNISGSTKNFTAQTLVLSPIPSFPIYTKFRFSYVLRKIIT